MTTIAQIITDAYQASNLVALSVIPSADEQAKALRYVNRIFKSLFGSELGDPLVDSVLDDTGVTYSDDMYPYDTYLNYFVLRANVRVLYRATTSLTAYMPVNPAPGSRISFVDLTGAISANPLTIDGSERNIEGSSTKILNTDSETIDWFYRDDLGSWQKISSLELEDEFPFPEEFEELFITLLAMRLNASEGISLDEQLGYVMKQVTKKFKARYRQTTPTPSELGLSRTPFVTRTIWRI